jgi:hypothetical protein
VVTANSVSDSIYDYPCQFTCDSFRKGSYLRATKWEVDMSQSTLIIHEAQYLGGAGCEVKHGRKWDEAKLKAIYNSKMYSEHFVILLQTKTLKTNPIPRGLEAFSIDSLKKRLSPKKRRMPQGELPSKKRVAFSMTETD